MTLPICIDLFCGLGGWSEGFLAEGYQCWGFDMERHDYGTGGYPGDLVLQDVLTLHGAQFKDAAVIVASPPCQKYSYMAMPWKRAKRLAKIYEPCPIWREELNRLFNACFRIQREAIEAAGRFIPLIVENVRGAQRWVGRSRWHFGSFHLWGDVPALMPVSAVAVKVGGIDFNGYGTPGYKGQSFNTTAEKRLRENIKNGGGSWFKVAHNTASEKGNNPDGRKKMPVCPKCCHAAIEQGVCRAGELCPACKESAGAGTKVPLSGRAWYAHGLGRVSSASDVRKMASAQIAKIPFTLARHICPVFQAGGGIRVTTLPLKERPILMHARSIQGILAGRKSQTRRIIKPQPTIWASSVPGMEDIGGLEWKSLRFEADGGLDIESVCPYGEPGSRLYVKETYWHRKTCPIKPRWPNAHEQHEGGCIRYQASEYPECDFRLTEGYRKHSSIHMPRWASRLVLEITDIRVERVQDISPDDCISEGVTIPVSPKGSPLLCISHTVPSHKLWRDHKNASGDDYITGNFALLWNDTNGKGTWERNPWVWVINFRRVV